MKNTKYNNSVTMDRILLLFFDQILIITNIDGITSKIIIIHLFIFLIIYKTYSNFLYFILLYSFVIEITMLEHKMLHLDPNLVQ